MNARLALHLDGPSAPVRAAALARLALVPALLAMEALETPQAPPDLAMSEPMLVLLALYALAAAVYAFAARRPISLAPFAIADVLVLSFLVYAEGGAPADARFALYVPVLVAAFVAGPRLTLALAGLSVAGYVGAALAHAAHVHDVADRSVVAHALDLGWRGGLAVTMSVFLTRRARRIRELADSRRSLVAQALGAEANARRELSYALHDELVQQLLCAQQDLKVARRGRPEYIDRAEAAIADGVQRLRGQIFQLHPHQLESVGLEGALEAVAAHHTRPGATPAAVTVAPDATGVDDELLFSVGRELLTNAARHAEASHVALVVERRGGHIVLTCRDDGRGLAGRRRSEALAEGHLGLAAATERVEALGGTFHIDSAPGRGTEIRVVVPAHGAPQADAEPGMPAPAPDAGHAGGARPRRRRAPADGAPA